MSNTLTFGGAIFDSFDDNVPNLDQTEGRQTNFTSSIQPHASLMIDRARWNSDVFYSPSFTYSSNSQSYNSTSHTLGGEGRYYFTKRLSFQVREALLATSSPSQTYEANSQLPPMGILLQQNQLFVGANVKTTSNQSQASLVYALGAHTSVGISGNFTSSRYESSASGSTINNAVQDSHGWAGSAFYTHQLTARYSVGTNYSAQRTTSAFDADSFSSFSHQVLGFVNVTLRPGIGFSVFAGPEITQLEDRFSGMPSIRQTQTSVAGGANFSWQGKRSGLNASLVQQVGSAGVGGEGTVTLRSINLQLQRHLTKLSSVSLTGSYTSNTQLDPLVALTTPNSGYVGITVSRPLSDRISMQFTAVRQQVVGNSLPGFDLRSHDMISASISYSWARPIGR